VPENQLPELNLGSTAKLDAKIYILPQLSVNVSQSVVDKNQERSGAESVLELKDIRKEFDVGEGTEVAVDSISIKIGESEFVSLVGPSGCGKTTTLRCIAGLETPTSGSIEMYGRDITAVPANKRNLAMMFQNIALYPHMKVSDNIGYPLKVRGIDKSERESRAEDAAKIMQIEDMLEKYPGEISGGQRQRAALARTIVQDPEAFLMDEPLSDLDAKLKMEIRKEIQKVHNQVEKPTVYVTHDQEEAMTMSDRIAVMNDGEIEQIGTPDELFSRPTDLFVAEFIGHPKINLLSGELLQTKESKGQIRIEGDIVDLSFAKQVNTQSTSDIILGFRPSDGKLVSDAGQGDVRGRISLLERTGDQKLATIDGPQGEIRVQLAVDTKYTEGEEVGIVVDPGRFHLFDQLSGEIMVNGANL
jgi:multiple sugar transport system ATP-binding protein